MIQGAEQIRGTDDKSRVTSKSDVPDAIDVTQGKRERERGVGFNSLLKAKTKDFSPKEMIRKQKRRET